MTEKMFWRDRPVFLTGATGLVGAWTAKALLEEGAELVCLVRDAIPQSEFYRQALDSRARIVRGDVRDQALMERVLGEYEVETVIHLAAQTIVGIANRNPVSTFESNIQGTWSLLEACRRSPRVGQIVVASSDKAYGEQPALPYTEETPLQGQHPYDVSKSCADLIALAYAKTYDLPVCVTRCGNFFGGGDLNWNRIVPGTIRSVIRGERPVLRSDGSLVREYFYVKDGAAAYMELAEAMGTRPELRGRAFNFSNEIRLTVLEVTSLILELMGSSLKLDIRNEATHEIPKQFLSARLARETLGWKPRYELRTALNETIAWYGSFFGEGRL